MPIWILQVDGYAGYPKLTERGDVELAFCWSHMRRNFYELATPDPAPIASISTLNRTRTAPESKAWPGDARRTHLFAVSHPRHKSLTLWCATQNKTTNSYVVEIVV
jgi:hypothetical protein